MEALAFLLILAIEFGVGGVVWHHEEEPGPTLAVLALAVIATLVLFAVLGDLSALDDELTP